MLPFHEEHELPVLRILTDRGTEYCGRDDKHDFQLFLAINDIDHTKTKVKSPQTPVRVVSYMAQIVGGGRNRNFTRDQLMLVV